MSQFQSYLFYFRWKPRYVLKPRVISLWVHVFVWCDFAFLYSTEEDPWAFQNFELVQKMLVWCNVNPQRPNLSPWRLRLNWTFLLFCLEMNPVRFFICWRCQFVNIAFYSLQEHWGNSESCAQGPADTNLCFFLSPTVYVRPHSFSQCNACTYVRPHLNFWLDNDSNDTIISYKTVHPLRFQIICL